MADSPQDSRVPHIATYRRVLPVPLVRLYENARDWEHLPWLHSSTFASIEVQEAGDWGWRAWSVLQPKEAEIRVLLELRLDTDLRRWITTTLEGPGAGTEIWTHAFAVDDQRTDINVDFFVPGLPQEQHEMMGAYYKELYARLYDEDVSMMEGRQSALDANKQRSNGQSADAGAYDEVRGRLPLRVETPAGAYIVAEHKGGLIAYSATCPHWLGPFDGAELRDGVVECPWHGYRFDVESGACVSGQTCKMPLAPEVAVEAGRIVLHFS